MSGGPVMASALAYIVGMPVSSEVLLGHMMGRPSFLVVTMGIAQCRSGMPLVLSVVPSTLVLIVSLRHVGLLVIPVSGPLVLMVWCASGIQARAMMSH